jgi:hypothetical protein
MGGFEKLKAAIFHERDVSPSAFQLQYVAMVARAKQNSLTFQRHASFPRSRGPRQSRSAALRAIIRHGHKTWARVTDAMCDECFRDAVRPLARWHSQSPE